MSRSLACLAAFFFLATAAAYAAEKAEPKAPEGEWTVQLKPAAGNKLKGTTQAYPDTITIKDGKFSTQVNTKYGFDAVACKVKTEGGKTLVTAELSDEKHGKNTYELTFSGTAVEGTMKWGKAGEDGKPKSAEYAVSGTKK
ncbi:MAG: hypothetical protein HY291_03535 [Planctomycetes bacterium]|nr:hypothetical protein [Planctomycetota bacterium]